MPQFVKYLLPSALAEQAQIRRKSVELLMQSAQRD
jgi:hypothetical protein